MKLGKFVIIARKNGCNQFTNALQCNSNQKLAVQKIFKFKFKGHSFFMYSVRTKFGYTTTKKKIEYW